jgi:hypothetical protein
MSSYKRSGAEWLILDLILERSNLQVHELVETIGNAAIVADAIETLQHAGVAETRGANLRLIGHTR